MEEIREEEKGSSYNTESMPAFSDEIQEKNKSFQASEEHDEDPVPELPTSVKSEPGSPLIDIKEIKSKTAVEEIKSSPSIQDIMNEDLRGNAAPEPQKKRKARTEDDLPSGPQRLTKEQKAEALADELAFYLMMEIRNNMFPQRVNPARLRLQTAEEIERVERQREEKSRLDSTLPESDKAIDDLKEDTIEEGPQYSMSIRTDPSSIRSYMKNLFDKIVGKEVDFIANLSSPLQRNPLEILMHLQNTQYELEEHEQLPYQQSVMAVDLYLDIERSRRKLEEQELNDKRAESKEKHLEREKQKDPSEPSSKEVPKDDSDSDNRSEYTRNDDLLVHLFNLKCEWENIHNKAIFDAVNEALDGLRPYGLKGPPLPWSRQNRTLTYKNGDVTEIPKIMQSVEKRVSNWVGEGTSTDLSPNMWEERLNIILKDEIEENEPIWTDYEFEETHVKMDLAEVIMDDLVDEIASFFVKRKDSISAIDQQKSKLE